MSEVGGRRPTSEAPETGAAALFVFQDARAAVNESRAWGLRPKA